MLIAFMEAFGFADLSSLFAVIFTRDSTSESLPCRNSVRRISFTVFYISACVITKRSIFKSSSAFLSGS